MSNSVRPQRRQPSRPCRPWDCPGKNTGVGCHFLLQCIKVKSESEVTQSFLTLSDPMDCSLSAPLSMGFSRQEYWSGVPLPSLMDCIDPWNYPCQNTGVGSPSLLQGIFPTQGSNPGLLNCRQILYHLSHQGSGVEEPGRLQSTGLQRVGYD